MKKREITVVIVEVVIAGLLVMAIISQFTPTPLTRIISPFTPTPGYHPDLSISMGIGGGFCVCGWQYEIDGNGNVSYELSGAHGSAKGSAKITPQQVGELVAAFMWANVWAWKDSYGIGWIICSDCPTVNLSITFHGWSRHISYYDGMCGGPQANDPAPQAVCDLQHKIEAIGKVAIPTPVPTSTPSPFMTSGDFGILSQEPCGPPCFLGIQPGTTTFDEAALILKNAGVPCEAITSGKSLLCQSGDMSTWVSTSGSCTPDNGGPMVAEIGLRPPAKITLGQFIAKYNQPDWLMIDPVLGTQATYDSLQTLVYLAHEPGPSYTVAPGTIIDRVVYVTAAEYSLCLHNPANTLQPWKGYGTYTPQMNP